MNNKVIGGIVAAVVIIAAIFLLTRPKGTHDASKPALDPTSSIPNKEADRFTSIKSLMADGRSQKCTFTTAEQGATSTGTFYVAGGKSRGDFNATVAGKTNASHMIFDGQTSYVWTEGMATGFKMKLDDSITANASSSAPQSVDPNKNMQFNCDSWSADGSMFVVPANIQFSDMSSMMGGVSSQAMPGSVNMSAVCDKLTEPAKAQCMAALQKK